MQVKEKHFCKFRGCKKEISSYSRWNEKKTKEWICWRTYCSHHNTEVYGRRRLPSVRKRLLRDGISNKCQLCGWDKATCDLHRVKERKGRRGYFKENLIVLCPNCHRIEHDKETEEFRKQIIKNFKK